MFWRCRDSPGRSQWVIVAECHTGVVVVAMATTPFAGFPPSTLKFLRALKKNNTKVWFDANRKEYEAAYKGPAKQFSTELAARVGRMTRKPHKAKVFRINRDLRFSKDKTPYNTHLHIGIVAEDAERTAPAWMFGLDAKTMCVGVGVMDFGPNLGAYREAVGGRGGATLAKHLAALTSEGARLHVEPELKRVPKGFEPDHPRADLLRRKNLSIWLDFDSPKEAEREDLISECEARLKQLKPVYNWVNKLS